MDKKVRVGASARRHARSAMLAIVVLEACCGLHLPRAFAGVITTGDTSTVVQLSDGTWHMEGEETNGTFYAGSNSDGTVIVSGAGFYTPTHDADHIHYPSASIGSQAGVVGSATVVGSDSSWVTYGLLEVGEFGTGTFSILKGGSTYATDMAAGGQTTGVGTIKVSGTGSHLTVTDNLLVGNLGSGTLTVTDHAAVDAAYAVIAGQGTSTSTIDTGSTFNATGSLIIGGANTGSLTVKGGSTLTAANITLAATDRGDGSLTIDGSTLHCTGVFAAANSYYSTSNFVSVMNGSTVTIGDLQVGEQPLGGICWFTVGGTNAGRAGIPDGSGLRSTLQANTIEVEGGLADGGGVQCRFQVIGGSLVTSGDVNVGGVDGFAYVNGFSSVGRSTWNAGAVYVFTGDAGGGLSVAGGGLLTSTGGWIDYGAAYVDGSGNGVQSTWAVDGPLWIGAVTGTQPYTLQITGGGLVTSGDSVIGDAANASGDGYVSIDGTDGGSFSSTWNANYLTVGNGYNGFVTVSNGGQLLCAKLTLGNAGSTGNLDVTDVGSLLNTNGGDFFIGGSGGGTGIFTMENGATATTGNVTIAELQYSTGTATIDGAGTVWTVTGGLEVGAAGNASLSITNGAVVNSDQGYVANTTNGVGTVTVDGAGSAWNLTDTLYVASATSDATVTISNGALISASNGITLRGGANTFFTVTNTGSKLTTTGTLSVGDTNTSPTLLVTNGGTVDAHIATVGDGRGSLATVLVTGQDATNTSSTFGADELNIGNLGTGQMTVEKGAQLNAAALTLGVQEGGQGYLTINGLGSTASFSQPGFIGDLGFGSFAVTGGAQVSAAKLTVGHGNNVDGSLGYGLLTVSGAGVDSSGTTASQLTVLHSLTVGDGGTGTLLVLTGGKVHSGDGEMKSSGEGAISSVSVDGTASTWRIDNLFEDRATNAKSSFEISNGGWVNTQDAEFDNLKSQALVTDSHSYFTVYGNLSIGVFRDGNLAVENGGTLQAPNIFLGEGKGNGQLDVGMTKSAVTSYLSGSNIVVGDYSGGVLNVGRYASANLDSLTVGTHDASSGIGTGNGTVNLYCTLPVTGAVVVGDQGIGNVVVHDGATLLTGDATVGRGKLGLGTVKVQNGTWQATGAFTVGDQGTGDVVIGDLNSKLTTGDAVLGNQIGSNGTVEFQLHTAENGGEWDAGNLIVGKDGTGEIDVKFGFLQAGDVTLGANSHGMGTVVLDNQLNLPGSITIKSFTVGGSGTGSVTIKNGQLQCDNLFIGDQTGSTGTVTVTSANTESASLLVQGPLVVGNYGSGTLTVSNGSVEVLSAELGEGTGASATITVVNSGASLKVDNTLTIGKQASSYVYVQNGGYLNAGDVVLGDMLAAPGGLVAPSPFQNKLIFSAGSGDLGSIQIGSGNAGGGYVQLDSGSVVNAATVGVGRPSGFSAAKLFVTDGSTLNIHNLTVYNASNGSNVTVDNGGVINVYDAATVGVGTAGHGSAFVSVIGGTINAYCPVDIGLSAPATVLISSLGSLTANGVTVYSDSELDVYNAFIYSNIIEKGGKIDITDVTFTPPVSQHAVVNSFAAFVAFASVFSAAAPASDINGDYDQTAGVLQIDIGGAGGWGASISGAATFTGGTIFINFINGYTPAPGDSFAFLTANSLSIGPDVTIESSIAGLEFSTSSDGSTLSFTALGGAAVPEPASAGLLLVGTVALLRKRRRS